MSLLDQLVKDINKKYGDGTILRASEAKSLVIDRTTSGIFSLDMCLGGGYPRGRLIMVKGEYSTGKSALTLKGSAQTQRHCRHCGKLFEYTDMIGEVHEEDCGCGKRVPMRVVVLDAEHSYDPVWAEKWGVNVNDVHVIQTEYAEQAIDVTDALIRSRECDLVVVDSVAALTPSVEVEESSEKWQVGVFARLMNKALRKWTSASNSFGLLAETKCTLLVINQMRLGLGGYRPTMTSPGGKGFDFFQSIEIRLKRVNEIVDPATDRPIGIEVECSVKKNKTAPRMPGGTFKLFFVSQKDGYKIGETDNDQQILRAAAYWKLIEKGGAWYTFPDGTKLQGDEKAAAAIRNNPELLKKLEEGVRLRELSWANEAQ